jgi:hypothetical protein
VIIDDPLLKGLTNRHSADPLSIYVLDQSRTSTGFCSKDLPIVALIAANHRRSIVLFTTRRADPNLSKIHHINLLNIKYRKKPFKKTESHHLETRTTWCFGSG